MPCSKGVINKTCPSRDSTRIAKHTFDAAKIGIISESCKYFAFYFHFLPPRTFNSQFFCIFATSIPTPSGGWGEDSDILRSVIDALFLATRNYHKRNLSRTIAEMNATGVVYTTRSVLRGFGLTHTFGCVVY